MTAIGQSRWTLEGVRVAVNLDDEPGILLRVDGRLVAVLIRLDAEYNAEHRGCWHMEAGFGPCSGQAPAPTARLSELLVWVAGRLGEAPHDHDDVLRHADAAF